MRLWSEADIITPNNYVFLFSCSYLLSTQYIFWNRTSQKIPILETIWNKPYEQNRIYLSWWSNSRMYMIELRSNESFRGLIGFDFSLGPIKKDPFDVFGYIQSWEDHRIQISTYLGYGGVRFIFLIDGVDANSIDIQVSEDRDREADYTFKPHWYQRVRFYG